MAEYLTALKLRAGIQRFTVPALLALLLCGSLAYSVAFASAPAGQEGGASKARAALALKDAAQKAFQEGSQYMTDKDYSSAVEKFMEAIEFDPDLVDAYTNLGFAYIELRNYGDAVNALKRALERTPDEAERRAAMHSNLGYAYGLNGMLDQAIEEYKKVIEVLPADANAYSALAFTYGQKGLVAEAAMAYNKALELKPNDKETMAAFGKLCRDNDLLAEAKTVYERLYKMDNNDMNAIRSLARLYLKLEAYPKAIEMHKKVLAVDPGSPDERLNLAMAFEKNGQVDSAISHYEIVLAAESDNMQSLCSLGFLYSDAKRPADAIEIAKRGLAVKDGDPCLVCAWGRALEKMTDYEGARAKFELVVRDPQWGAYAKKQIERQDKLIKRREALKEKEQLGY
jgi:tetratricopeptide (TPR) repeat protein